MEDINNDEKIKPTEDYKEDNKDRDRRKHKNKHKRVTEKDPNSEVEDLSQKHRRKKSRRHKEKGKLPENGEEKVVLASKDTNAEESKSEQDETNDSEVELKKSVSWKENIEQSCEFQSSVLEQNVFVSVDAPDEEFETAGSKNDKKPHKSKGEKVSYIWDKYGHGMNMIFNANRPHVITRAVAKQSTDGVRGYKGFIKGRHTFKFTFNDKPWGSNCSLGICTANAQMHCKGYQHLFGADHNSWVWDIPSGCLLNAGETKQHFLTAIEEKTIYMTVDLNKGNVYFQPKGRDRFLAFKGLKDIEEELFPCVCLVYGMAEVKISLKHTTDPLIWLEKTIIIDQDDEPEIKPVDNDFEKQTGNEEALADIQVESEPGNMSSKQHKHGSEVEKRDTNIPVERKEVSLDESSNSESSLYKVNDSITVTSKAQNDSITVTSKAQNQSQGDSLNAGEADAQKVSSRSIAIPEPKTNTKEQDFRISEKDEPINELSHRTEHPEHETKRSPTLIKSTTGDHGFKKSNEEEPKYVPFYQREKTNEELDMSLKKKDMFERNNNGQEQSNSVKNEERDSPVDRSLLYRKPSTVSWKDSTVPAVPTKESQVGNESNEDVVRNPEDNDFTQGGIPDAATYRKLSTLSWMDSSCWKSNDLYIVDNGNIIKQHFSEKEFSVLSNQTNSTISNMESEQLEESWSEGIPEPAVYVSPSIVARLRTNNEIILDEEEEPEDVTYTKVEDLGAHEAYTLQMSHGWDQTHRGGCIQLYPNLPHVCLPMPSFGDKVQGLRGRQGFSEGIHSWQIKELKLFSPSVSLNDMHMLSNKLHIGVVDSEHRTFNYGYALMTLGPHAWAYEVETGLECHGQTKKANFTMSAGANADDAPSIDMSKGVEMTLNMYKHKLTLHYEGMVIAEFTGIRGKAIYPFVLFNNQGLFPVEIKYLEGPSDYIEQCLLKLENMKTTEKEELDNYRGLTRQLSTKSSMIVIENTILNTYDWGTHTNGLTIKWGHTIKLASDNAMQGKAFAAIAEKPLQSQRHKLEFATTHIGSFIFALVSETFDQKEIDAPSSNGLPQTDTVTVFGSNIHSWAWDPITSSIYHGNHYLGKYPSGAIEFDYSKYNRLRLIVDFSSTGYNIASFTAVNDDTRESKDLGIAFVNLPGSVYPSVALVAGRTSEKTELEMKYVAGPKAFVSRTVESKLCTIM